MNFGKSHFSQLEKLIFKIMDKKKQDIIHEYRAKLEVTKTCSDIMQDARANYIAAQNGWKESHKSAREAKQKLDYLSPYQVGDIVIVKDALNVGNTIRPVWTDGTGIVSRIIVSINSKEVVSFEYKVNAIKKNGKMSTRALRSAEDTYNDHQFKKL